MQKCSSACSLPCRQDAQAAHARGRWPLRRSRLLRRPHHLLPLEVAAAVSGCAGSTRHGRDVCRCAGRGAGVGARPQQRSGVPLAADGAPARLKSTAPPTSCWLPVPRRRCLARCLQWSGAARSRPRRWRRCAEGWRGESSSTSLWCLRHWRRCVVGAHEARALPVAACALSQSAEPLWPSVRLCRAPLDPGVSPHLC